MNRYVYIEPDKTVSSHSSPKAEFYWFLTREGAQAFGGTMAKVFGHLWSTGGRDEFAAYHQHQIERMPHEQR